MGGAEHRVGSLQVSPLLPSGQEAFKPSEQAEGPGGELLASCLGHAFGETPRLHAAGGHSDWPGA